MQHLLIEASSLADKGALDSRSEGLVFDSQCWPCVEVVGKLRIPHCLGPPSCNGYLVHRSKVGSIVVFCIGAHLARGKVCWTCVVMESGLYTTFTFTYQGPYTHNHPLVFTFSNCILLFIMGCLAIHVSSSWSLNFLKCFKECMWFLARHGSFSSRLLT